jgi:hypothetical protein
MVNIGIQNQNHHVYSYEISYEMVLVGIIREFSPKPTISFWMVLGCPL